jgi:hypothetical protein
MARADKQSKGDREAADAPSAPIRTLSGVSVMALASAALVVLLPAVPLMLTTTVHIEVVARLEAELDAFGGAHTPEGPTLKQYNECMMRMMAERAKHPCEPGDARCQRERSLERCDKPRELKLMNQADMDAALGGSSEVRKPVMAVLTQRQTVAVTSVWRAAQGWLFSVSLALLLGMAGTLSALGFRARVSGGFDSEKVERQAQVAAVALAALALLAAVAAAVALALLAEPGWSLARLASSRTLVTIGTGAAVVAALVAGLGAFTMRKALLAIEDDADDDEWEDEDDDDGEWDEEPSAGDE